METLDEDLCEFFFEVTKKHLTYLTVPAKVKLVRKVLAELRRRYKGDRPKREGHCRKFHSLGNVSVSSLMEDAAHSYEFNAILASSAATSFSELVADNGEFFGEKVRRKSVGIWCIAGGMAPEVVAIVETLYRSTEGDCGKQEFLNIHLAFVDADDRWQSVAAQVMGQLGDFVREKYKVKLTSRFVLSQNRHEVLEVLRSSDVLVTTKFSAQLSGLREKLFQQSLEEALQHMKSHSLFFIIDNSAATTIKRLEQEISKFGRFQTVFSKTFGNHSLSLDSARRHLQPYNDYFGVDLTRSYCFFSARAWLKS